MDAGEYRHAHIYTRDTGLRRHSFLFAPQCVPRLPDRASHHVHLRRDRPLRLQHRKSDHQRHRPGAEERVQQRRPRVRVHLFLTTDKD